MATIGEVIEYGLKRCDMTQKELAKEIFVTPQAVSKWIAGESRPTVDNMMEIDKVLGTNLAKMLFYQKRAEKKGKNMKIEIKKLNEITDFKTAQAEANKYLASKNILINYSHPVCFLLELLLPAVIGLTCYQKKHHKNDDIDEENIFLNLYDYIDDASMLEKSNCYENYLEYNFYLMGMDLAEMFDEENKEKEFIQDSVASWYKFSNAITKSNASPIYNELKVAIAEICQ